MKILVSILIVNYNGSVVLKGCLQSLSKLRYRDWELIIVDNGSTESEQRKIHEYVKKYSLNSKTKIINLSENLGFAEGNNVATKFAHGKYLLLLNNDTVVPSDLLEVLVKKMDSDTSIGVLQPKIRFMDDPEYLDNAGAFLNPIGLTIHWGYAEKDREEFNHEREIFSAKGACMMTPLSLVKKIGLFDKRFGSYFEESDFCFRVWLFGYRVLYYPGTSILHKVGYTSKGMDQIQVLLRSTRNRIFSLFKNLSVWHLITILLPHVVFLTFLGFYYAVRLQFRKVTMVFSSIFWNISNISLLISERKKVQSLRKKSDNEIFPIIMQPLNLVALFNHFKKVEENLNKL